MVKDFDNIRIYRKIKYKIHYDPSDNSLYNNMFLSVVSGGLPSKILNLIDDCREIQFRIFDRVWYDT